MCIRDRARFVFMSAPCLSNARKMGTAISDPPESREERRRWGRRCNHSKAAGTAPAQPFPAKGPYRSARRRLAARPLSVRSWGFEFPACGDMHTGTEPRVHVEVTCFSVCCAFDFRYASELVIVTHQLLSPHQPGTIRKASPLPPARSCARCSTLAARRTATT